MNESRPTNPGDMDGCPSGSAPPWGSTTHRFTTQAGHEAYQERARSFTVPMPVSPAEDEPELGFDEPNLGYETGGRTDPIKLMVRKAITASQEPTSDSNSLTQAGVRIPHPEAYSGEEDLEKFEMFILGLLRWLSMNHLLGPDKATASTQVKYVGTRLAGPALEWYSRKVEHHDRTQCHWDLTSTLIGLRDNFLHALTHRHASAKFDAARQGNGTGPRPGEQAGKVCRANGTRTRCVKRFLTAVRELLSREILSRGYTAELAAMRSCCSL